MPALIAAKASSSGTGVGFQVIIMSPCCNQDRVSESPQVHAERSQGIDRGREGDAIDCPGLALLTATFATTTSDASPSFAVLCTMIRFGFVAAPYCVSVVRKSNCFFSCMGRYI